MRNLPNRYGSEHQILHLVASTRRRGAEVFALDLAGALQDQGIPGCVLALTGGGSLPVEVVGRGRFHPGTIRSLRTRARSASTVIGHGSSTLIAAYLATAGTTVPFVYRNIGDPEHWVDTRFRSWRVGAALRRASAVVALWPDARRALIERHDLDPERVAVAPNGVPVDRFPVVTSKARRDAREQLGLSRSVPVVCSIGSLSAEKDPVTVIQSTALVSDAHLVLAGDGPMRNDLERLAGEVLPGRVSFLSELEDVRPVLAAADVLHLASRTEGLPGVLIEAGLSALPVVATRVGGTSQIVRHGETGYLVPYGDVAAASRAIQQALAERDLLGARARRHCVERFALDAVADRWATIVHSVRSHTSSG